MKMHAPLRLLEAWLKAGAARAAVLLLTAGLVACAGPQPQSGDETQESGARPPGPSVVGGVLSGVPVDTADAVTDVDLASCLEVARGAEQPSEARCPGFISGGLTEMVATCAEAGGRLQSAGTPSIASLDLNGDGRPEFLYDATNNFRCEGAPSLFSCGSLGCPVSLFERGADAWRQIGAMSATDAPAAEVLASPQGGPYYTLRGGCVGQRPCDEWTYYVWDGEAYRAQMVDVRGNWVDLANDGLWTLAADVAVLASPSPDARVLQSYPAGTEVVVIGDARGTSYKFVSPCNACQSGFVSGTVLRKVL
jgi:hypothetical protein